MKKSINEAFASSKLAALAKEHGGIDVSRNGGIRNGAKAYFGGSSVDVSKITDDMITGEPFKYDYLTTPDKANLIHFKDGYAVSLKPYDLKNSDNINPPKPRKKPSRYSTGIGDTGDHDKTESPFFKNGKKDIGPQYNGYGVSKDAGEAQGYRNAFKNNKEVIDYFSKNKDRDDASSQIAQARNNINYIKGQSKDLLGKKVKISESDINKMVSDCIELLRELTEPEKNRFGVTNFTLNYMRKHDGEKYLPFMCTKDEFFGKIAEKYSYREIKSFRIYERDFKENKYMFIYSDNPNEHERLMKAIGLDKE